MSYTLLLLSVYVVICLISIVHGQQNAEPICSQLNSKNARWYCKKVAQCPFSQQLLHGKKAKHCGYEQHSQKICCPVQVTGLPTKKPVPNPPVVPITTAPAKKDYATIAWQKCIEYSRARYTYISKPAPVLGQKPINSSVLDCVPVTPLIVGGVKAEERELPHMALIGYIDRINDIEWACGGSLISEQFVLSAAHCTVGGYGPVKWVGMGILKRDQLTPDSLNKNIFRVIHTINHPNYKASLKDNDIALYKLQSPVQFTPRIRPICLYANNEIPKITEEKSLISGWGREGAGTTQSERLMKAKIYFIENDKCASSFAEANLKNGFDKNTMVCAGDLNNATDTCEGDSGGPLQIPIDGLDCMWSTVGIVSVGSPFCGDKETPAIYTKVSHFLPWISEIVWP